MTTVPELKGIDYFFFLLDKVFPEYSFWLNVNTARTNVIFGKEFRLLKGPGFYDCQEGGITYEVGPRTFVAGSTKMSVPDSTSALFPLRRQGTR